MRLLVERILGKKGFTPGNLYVDGVFECNTLEDETHDGPKIPGETSIPEGSYRVDITESARFKRLLPILLDVPGFTGVRIHPGNTTEDTAGCLLVGTRSDSSPSIVSESRIAFDNLFAKMCAAHAKGEIIAIEVR